MGGDNYLAGETFTAFPYAPYDIQQGFMQALYQALDKGGVGLFESPTGTGKTLSLICGSLHWLDDYRKKQQEQQAKTAADKTQDTKPKDTAADNDDVPDWITEFASQKDEQRQKDREERRKKRLEKAKATIQKDTAAAAANKHSTTSSAPSSEDPDAEFLVDEYNSDGGEAGDGTTRHGIRKRSVLSEDDTDSDLGEGLGDDEDEELDAPRRLQIIFCSRTHSQLTQFVGELHRTYFADAMSLVALGSRKALCINEAVASLNSASLINERCLDLQKPGSSSNKKLAAAAAVNAVKPQGKNAKTSSSGKCAYLGAGTSAADTTRDIILAQPIDIEELSKLGRRKSVCPYYAARRAVPEADIVLVPYTSLIMEDTRKSLGLHIQDNVIIVDEAHNLVDAINSTHSAELPITTAATAAAQLQGYFDRFKTQLAAGNAKYIQILVRIATVLSQSTTLAAGAAPSAAVATSTGSAAKVNDFLFATGLDNINMFKLVRYVKESKIVFKVAGYSQAQRHRALAKQQQEAQKQQKSKKTLAAAAITTDPLSTTYSPPIEGATGALHALVSFLYALTNNDADGRVIIDTTSHTVKFVLLNAATHFAQVVSQARAVILASGTLSPLESVMHLFPSVPRDSIHHYSCGHVVGQDRLLALSVGSGPSNQTLDFRMETRATSATVQELGRLLVNVCNAVPGGVVVFFPSFKYADQVYAQWAESGVLKQLSSKKKVFREPREALEVESTLEEYAHCIEKHCKKKKKPGGDDGDEQQQNKSTAAVVHTLGSATTTATAVVASTKRTPSTANSTSTGAIMLCVVGGKLAEGINFSDDLGRLVVMVGLPYPNAADPELQERLQFIDRTASNAGGGGGNGAASREHYLNLCMKAVNQCVGRVIRHRGDYAAILLVDTRYVAGVLGDGKYSGPVAKLPDWIKQSLVGCKGFGDAYGRLVRFFKQKRD